MRYLRYSKDLKEVVEIKDALTAEEAMSVLVDELLGENYYISDSMGSEQAYSILVVDILKKYKK